MTNSFPIHPTASPRSLSVIINIIWGCFCAFANEEQNAAERAYVHFRLVKAFIIIVYYHTNDTKI